MCVHVSSGSLKNGWWVLEKRQPLNHEEWLTKGLIRHAEVHNSILPNVVEQVPDKKKGGERETKRTQETKQSACGAQVSRRVNF